MLWPDEEFALPQREADFGGAQERAMASVVGGYGGIRTVEFVNPDGSIERLRTRNGWPIFEKEGETGGAATPSADLARGFVAKIPSGRAVLFNPYTLAVINPQYTLAKNTYTVQDFATPWNVPVGDTTHWYDVVLFDGTTVKVNAKAMGSLLVTGNHGYPAIPYVINRNDASDQYGNAERNTTEKRVFAVGRYQVNSWGGGGVTATLTPADARSENRAMTIGQRLDFSANMAWLGQLFYPSGQDWDGAGEWYFTSAQAQMLLTATYLVKVAGNANVAMSPPALTLSSPSSGSSVISRDVPDAIMQLYASHGEPQGPDTYLWERVGYPWDGYTTGSVTAIETINYSRVHYAGSTSDTETVAGVDIEVSITNDFVADTNYSVVSYPDQLTHITPNLYAEVIFALDGSSSGDPINYGTRQGAFYGVFAKTFTGVNWTSDASTVAFSVGVSGAMLVQGSGYRRKEAGNDIGIYQNDWTVPYLANPRGNWDGGFGYNLTGFGVKVHGLGDSGTGFVAVSDPHRTQWESMLASKVALFAAADCTSNLDDFDMYAGRVVYISAVTSRPKPDTQVLTWSTKDYLLHDADNGVFITVEGIFSGIDNVATLTVLLKVQTRFNTTTQVLGTFNYTYSEMLPETEIGVTGKYAIPSPQIRAIFAPLYQEQGSFKGAHYVTQLEEANGAASFHGFNFVLKLRMYGDLHTVNADNDNFNEVYFVPCNLLEMLYAFVFSQEYGVAESGERYPVTYTTRFSDMQSTLFSTPIRVTVRDGTAGNWTDTLGSDFASIGTTSLHRA